MLAVLLREVNSVNSVDQCCGQQATTRYTRLKVGDLNCQAVGAASRRNEPSKFLRNARIKAAASAILRSELAYAGARTKLVDPVKQIDDIET